MTRAPLPRRAIVDDEAAAPTSLAERTAVAGLDVWDTAAHLESRGISRRVAEERGFGSVFALARHLIDAVPHHARRPARGTHTHRPAPSVLAAILRAIVMLCGVVVCVSSVPRGTGEVTMFAIAAAGWLAGQAVSSSVWFAWGESTRPDALRTGLAVGAAVLLAGLAWVLLRGDWALLVWLGWGASMPILLTAMPAAVLAAGTAVAAAVCGGALAAANGYPGAPVALGPWGMPVAVASTTLAIALAAALVLREARGRPSRYVRGTALAVGVAVVQTGAQLSILLMIFVGVGRGAFGAIALAALAAGVLADPLFTIGQVWTRRVVESAASWSAGRFRIGLVAVVLVALLLLASAAVAWWYLSDPYHIYLNAPWIIAAAVLIGAVIAATNVLLRTGSAVGAMVFALVAQLVMAPTSFVPGDEAAGFWVMCAATVLVTALALWQAAQRFARPSTW